MSDFGQHADEAIQIATGKQIRRAAGPPPAPAPICCTTIHYTCGCLRVITAEGKWTGGGFCRKHNDFHQWQAEGIPSWPQTT